MNAQPSSPFHFLTAPWRASAKWLSNVPIDDPVDRRNAPMLELVLIVLGFVPPLLWLYRIAGTDIPWRAGETASLAMSLATSAIAIASLVLIRYGRFKWAAAQLLVVVAVFMIVSYAESGFEKQAYEQPVQVVWIVVAGLVLGRRALWSMYGCHLAAFAVGLAVDLQTKPATEFDAWSNQLVSAVITAVIFLLVAVVVDRSVAALRESLREATERGNALALANSRLSAEIDERTRVQEQLVHAQKVEAVGRLASGVAHDFNHLLALVLGYAENGRRSEDVADLRKSLAGVEAAARRAAATTQTLLTFSRRDATRLETFDAAQALREMQPMLQQLFDSGVRISIDVSPGPAPIRFDRAQFTLVVLNIAANANHAMPDGGRFRVAARTTEDARVEVEFTDTGHGMSEDVQRRIFEPFFTTKPAGQGTGLGLAVTADLVRSAGGEVSVCSELAQGATFRVLFPLAIAPLPVGA